MERKQMINDMHGNKKKGEKQGVYMTRSPSDRNKYLRSETSRKKQDQSSALKLGLPNLHHAESSPKKL